MYKAIKLIEVHRVPKVIKVIKAIKVPVKRRGHKSHGASRLPQEAAGGTINDLAERWTCTRDDNVCLDLQSARYPSRVQVEAQSRAPSESGGMRVVATTTYRAAEQGKHPTGKGQGTRATRHKRSKRNKSVGTRHRAMERRRRTSLGGTRHREEEGHLKCNEVAIVQC